MTNFSSSWAAHGANFTDAVRREVIEVHVALIFFFFQSIERLGVLWKAERQDRHDLRLATREESRAVNARQKSSDGFEFADFVQLSTVGSLAVLDDELSNRVLDRLVHGFIQLSKNLGLVRVNFFIALDDLFGELAQARFSGSLVRIDDRGLDFRPAVLLDPRHEVGIDELADRLSLGLARDLGELLELDADRLDRFMSELQGSSHVLFRDLGGAGFDHRDRAFVPGNDQVEVALGDLGDAREEDQLAVDSGDADASNGTIERDIAQGKRRSRGIHRQNVGWIFLIDGERHRDDLHVVAHALRKERANGSVDQSAGQDRPITRTAAALDEAAWDFPDGVFALFVIADERKKVDAFASRLAHRGGAEQDGFAHAEQDRAARLTSYAARFEAEGLAPNFESVGVNHGCLRGLSRPNFADSETFDQLAVASDVLVAEISF